MKWFRVVGLGLCAIAFSGGLQAAQEDPPPLDQPALESQPAAEAPASPAADLQPAPEAAPRLAAAGLDGPVKPLMEGPLHEAFLSPAKNLDPVPHRQGAPAPIVERPGVDPPNPNAQWIEGYWEWDASRKDFVWVTGTWRVPPPGKFWVNGYWRRDDKGWYRVPGFWSDRKTDRIDFRKNGPPADHPADEPGEAPGPDYFYVPGQYYPDGNGVVWKPGFWAKAQPGWAWVPAQWVQQPEGWTFQEGYWDRTLEDRGTLFTPAQVRRRPRTADTVYQPYSQVAPESYGQLYGAFGRPNSYYDGYPGCYYDHDRPLLRLRPVRHPLALLRLPRLPVLRDVRVSVHDQPGGLRLRRLWLVLRLRRLGLWSRRRLAHQSFGFGYGYPYYGLGYGGLATAMASVTAACYGYGGYGGWYGYGGSGSATALGYGGFGYGYGGYGGFGFGYPLRRLRLRVPVLRASAASGSRSLGALAASTTTISVLSGGESVG